MTTQCELPTHFLGYRRPDGSTGVRNHVVVMSSVSCANAVVEGIGRAVPGVQTVTHIEGCGRGPADIPRTVRTLAGVACNPNVAAVLVVGLGCETIKAAMVGGMANGTGKPVETLSIQEEGGTPKSIARGAEIARAMVEEAHKQERVQAPISELTIAVECGGSDALSGLTANPVVGVVSDWIVGQGGTVILSEVTEFIGAEAAIADRCEDAAVRAKVDDLLTKHAESVKRELGAMASLVISPGNMDGGLSSIAEKSLGCIRKGGTTPIRDVVDYAEAPKERGLVIMNTPGSDIFSLTGKISGGAQLALFTTGRGSPAGSPIAPVVKIASNTKLFEWMSDDMDFNAGQVVGGRSIADVGAELIALVVDVASGRSTCPERTRTELFAIHTTSSAF